VGRDPSENLISENSHENPTVLNFTSMMGNLRSLTKKCQSLNRNELISILKLGIKSGILREKEIRCSCHLNKKEKKEDHWKI